jgi:VWFA-related protein
VTIRSTAWLGACAGIAAAIVVGLPVHASLTQDPQLTFRSLSSLVPVHVSVRSGRSFVPGLTAADFELSDNGVRQQIDTVSSDVQATDVTLVVDTSGSVTRSIGRFRSDVTKIAGLLKPGEQVRLITFDSDVRESFPMQDPRNARVDDMIAGHMTSLADAMVFALARAPRPGRHHLVFVFTDGYDNASVMSYGALPGIAARSDAVLYVVLVKVTGVPDAPPPLAFDALADAATRTGGEYFAPSEEPLDVASAFKQALESFRHTYVLYFVPRGVPPAGWHQLTVRVTRPGKYDVQARQGYFGG